MDRLQDLTDFVTHHGGVFVRRDSYVAGGPPDHSLSDDKIADGGGGDTVEQVYLAVPRGELRLSRSIRDGLGCAVRETLTEKVAAGDAALDSNAAEGEWQPIFAHTVPGFDMMDVETAIAWVTSVPQGDAYIDFLKRHISDYLDPPTAG